MHDGAPVLFRHVPLPNSVVFIKILFLFLFRAARIVICTLCSLYKETSPQKHHNQSGSLMHLFFKSSDFTSLDANAAFGALAVVVV